MKLQAGRFNRKGQALVMVTFALFAMIGVIGLSVDLGWSFFVRKAAQSAADTAAMAAATEALRRVGAGGTFACGANLICQAATACPASITTPTNNIENGCIYARQNGFRTNGNGGRQSVTMTANVPAASCGTVSPPNCIPSAPGIDAAYYVTAQVAESIPQLFSAILGNGLGVASARATAAIADSVVIGALILLNRENDNFGGGGGGNTFRTMGQGKNLRNDGGPTIQAPGGILLASQCNGTNCASGAMAGELGGNATVSADFTYVRGVGKACAGNIAGCGGGSSTWIVPPTNNQPLGSTMFMDPMRDKGQPTIGNANIDRPINGGVISGGPIDNPTRLGAGSYYAVNGSGVATGGPITLNGSGQNKYFVFESCTGCSGTQFGDFVFFGGLRTGSGNASVKFTPGRYVMAGTTGGADAPLMELSNGTELIDYTPDGGTQIDAGQMILFTDANYPGLTHIPNAITGIQSNLQQGVAGISMGQNDNSLIRLHGINPTNTEFVQGTALENFAPVVMWMDQRNSIVQYDSTGNIATSCSGGYSASGTVSIDNPCHKTARGSEKLYLKASPNTNLFGTVYMPRGSFLDLQGSGGMTAPLKIITGALNVGGTPNITLTSTANPVRRKVVALVE